MDAVSVAHKFVDAINAHDCAALAELMTEDHLFVALTDLVCVAQITHRVAVVVPLIARRKSTDDRHPAQAREVASPHQALRSERVDDFVEVWPHVVMRVGFT